MRVWIDGVETIYPARWFFCDPDAEWFPSPHGAEANPWLKDFEVNEEWGDDGTVKKLDRGINPGYPGKCFVGDPQWFIDGHLPAGVGAWTPPVLTPCCGHFPPPNPDPRCPVPTTVICDGCAEGIGPMNYRVDATGGTGDFAMLNGSHIMPNVAPCAWGAIQEGRFSQNLKLHPDLVSAELAANPVGGSLVWAAYGSVLTGPVRCMAGPFTLPLAGSSLSTGSPPSYTVTPLL